MLLYADFKRVNEGLENNLRDNLRFRVVVFAFYFLMVAWDVGSVQQKIPVWEGLLGGENTELVGRKCAFRSWL